MLWVALCVMISCRGTMELCVTELVSWLCSRGRACVMGVDLVGLVLWVALCVMISCRGTMELCVTELVRWLCSHGRDCVMGVLS